MESLAKTNPHLRDPQNRRMLLLRNAVDSSVFEGATGLVEPDDDQLEVERRTAETKKEASGSTSPK